MNLGSTPEWAVEKVNTVPLPADSIHPRSEDQHSGHCLRGAKIRAWHFRQTWTRSLPSRVPSQNACVQGCTSGSGLAVSTSTSGLLSPDGGDVVETGAPGGVLVHEAAVRDLPLAGPSHQLAGGLHVGRRAHPGSGVAAAGGVTDRRPGDVTAERHPALGEEPSPFARRR